MATRQIGGMPQSIDHRDQLSTVNDGGVTPIAQYTYDAAERMQGRAYRNGTVAAYTYTERNKKPERVAPAHMDKGQPFLSELSTQGKHKIKTAKTEQTQTARFGHGSIFKIGTEIRLVIASSVNRFRKVASGVLILEQRYTWCVETRKSLVGQASGWSPYTIENHRVEEAIPTRTDSVRTRSQENGSGYFTPRLTSLVTLKIGARADKRRAEQ